MAITINGDGTLTGISVGGLPDGIVDTDMLATDAVSAAKLQSTAVTSGDLPTGSILQVIQTVKTSFFSTTTTDSWVDVTGVSVAITPASTSNKILLMCTGYTGNGNNDSFHHLRILRDSTSISIGDARGSSTRSTMNGTLRAGGGSSGDVSRAFACHILDSPSTTSEVTYKLQMFITQGTPGCIGGSNGDTDDNRSSTPTFIPRS